MPATIKLGDTGDDVKRLQRVFTRMKVLGPDAVDGVFGQPTDQAVRDFQQSEGLLVDGIVGPVTWTHLPPYREASPALQTGSLGPVVAMLQGVLKTGFGYSGAIDGMSARLRRTSCVSTRPTQGSRPAEPWTSGPGWHPPAPREQRSRASPNWSPKHRLGPPRQRVRILFRSMQWEDPYVWQHQPVAGRE